MVKPSTSKGQPPPQTKSYGKSRSAPSSYDARGKDGNSHYPPPPHMFPIMPIPGHPSYDKVASSQHPYPKGPYAANNLPPPPHPHMSYPPPPHFYHPSGAYMPFRHLVPTTGTKSSKSSKSSPAYSKPANIFPSAIICRGQRKNTSGSSPPGRMRGARH